MGEALDEEEEGVGEGRRRGEKGYGIDRWGRWRGNCFQAVIRRKALLALFGCGGLCAEAEEFPGEYERVARCFMKFLMVVEITKDVFAI